MKRLKRGARRIAMVVCLTMSVPTVPGFAETVKLTATESTNLATATAFYNAALNDKDADKARSYLGARYVQHNPAAKDGPEGLAGFVGFLRAQFPQNRSEIKRSFASGDYVILHVHNKRTPESRGNAIMEIFRLEQGKIVEHWDVIQEIPEKAANANGMF